MDECVMDADDQRLSDAAWEAERARHYAEYRLATPAERAVAGRNVRWVCCYCGNERASENGTGSDVVCCSEVGHVEPMGVNDEV